MNRRMKILIAYDGRLERAWLGSTSTAVIGRAHCSVEVVRSKASE